MSGISTPALHADRDVYPTRAVAPPIYQTATFWAEDAEQFARAAVTRQEWPRSPPPCWPWYRPETT